MSSPALPIAPPQQPSPVPRPRRLGGPYRVGRPSRRVTNGRLLWLGRLQAAGRHAEAAAYAARYRLTPPAPAPAGLPPAPAPAAPETLPPAATGGEGVSLDQPAANWDKTAPIGANLQCDLPAATAPIPQILQSTTAELTPAVAVAAVVAAALADPALAAGGGEGGLGVGVGAGAGGLAIPSEEAIRQEVIAAGTVEEQLMKNIPVDQKWGNFPNYEDMYLDKVIGVVGRRCRNKWYVEVCVEGRWGKAEIGDWVVSPHDRVVVELAWKSADGRDEEWRIVEEVQEAPAAEPVPVVAQLEDFDSGEPEVPTPAEQEHPAAYDFMEQARRAAYAAYAR